MECLDMAVFFAVLGKFLFPIQQKRFAGCAQMRDENSCFTARIWRTKCCKSLKIEGLGS